MKQGPICEFECHQKDKVWRLRDSYRDDQSAAEKTITTWSNSASSRVPGHNVQDQRQRKKERKAEKEGKWKKIKVSVTSTNTQGQRCKCAIPTEKSTSEFQANECNRIDWTGFGRPDLCDRTAQNSARALKFELTSNIIWRQKTPP